MWYGNNRYIRYMDRRGVGVGVGVCLFLPVAPLSVERTALSGTGGDLSKPREQSCWLSSCCQVCSRVLRLG